MVHLASDKIQTTTLIFLIDTIQTLSLSLSWESKARLESSLTKSLDQLPRKPLYILTKQQMVFK